MATTAVKQVSLLSDNRNSVHTVRNVHSSRDYTLNPDRALLKKLIAAKRQQVEYVVTGGGIKATMDAVSFELFRFACDDYYQSYNDNLFNVKVDESKDNKGNTVQYTYFVMFNNSTSYTVNLYPTRCSLLINGKAIAHFTDTDLPKIHELMLKVSIQGRPVNVKSLNDILAQQLQKLINDRSHPNAVQPTKPVSTRRMIQSSQSYPEDIACIKCNRNCRKNAFLCQNNHWIHYHCDKMNQERISEIESASLDNMFVCNTCNNKCVIKIPTLSPPYALIILYPKLFLNRYSLMKLM